jgi:hypothetical protein
LEPDVIISCITGSSGGDIPGLEKGKGPRLRGGEKASYIAPSYAGGDGVNPAMPVAT